MYARLSSYQGEAIPADVDLAVGSDTAVKQVREIPGFRGVYLLADRASGRTLTLTLWEDEEAMAASEARATKIRQESAEREQQRVISVERYEVGVAHLES
jgi:heme-degrading monooxygenase HmoA